MVGEVAAPGLGVDAGWDDASDGWGPGMNTSLVKLSMASSDTVLSRTTVLPGSPTQGDMYIVPTGETNENQIAGYHKGAWVYIVPVEGMSYYVQDDDERVTWNGTAWAAPVAVTPEIPDRVWAEKTANYTLVVGDFDGRTVIAVNSASDLTVTIPESITPTKGVMVARMGAGTVTLVAGGATVIRSEGGHLQIGERYQMVAIIPTATADEYLAIGPLATP